MKSSKQAKAKYLYIFVSSIILLMIIGVIMLASVSSVVAFKAFGNTNELVIKQLTQGVLIGLVAMLLLWKVDYHSLRYISVVGIVLSVILLAMVKFTPFGVTSNGAVRWLDLFGLFRFQPSEFAKLALIVYSATLLSRPEVLNAEQFKNKTLPILLVTLLIFGLIMVQPDLGTGLIILLIGMTMLFLGETRILHLVYLSLAGVIATFGLIQASHYRLQRLLVFMNPGSDPLGSGYHINQSLLSIGIGGVFGVGYGLSRQKYYFLPESYTDSIFAIMCEELGFIRISIIICIFLVMIISGFYVAKNTPDVFGKLLISGIVSFIAFQTIINIGAISGLLPLTGVTLPFFSYGSSSLIVMLASVGIVLSTALHKEKTGNDI